ncbi:MAG: DUF4357 domain-containing protein, partial [Gemmatimonadales bacterium]
MLFDRSTALQAFAMPRWFDGAGARRGPELPRKALLSEGFLQVATDRLVFARDHLFGSPSTAAMTVLGRRANGWTAWKDKAGRTLDDWSG